MGKLRPVPPTGGGNRWEAGGWRARHSPRARLAAPLTSPCASGRVSGRSPPGSSRADRAGRPAGGREAGGREAGGREGGQMPRGQGFGTAARGVCPRSAVSVPLMLGTPALRVPVLLK